jgi:hypothetical protein
MGLIRQFANTLVVVVVHQSIVPYSLLLQTQPELDAFQPYHPRESPPLSCWVPQTLAPFSLVCSTNSLIGTFCHIIYIYIYTLFFFSSLLIKILIISFTEIDQVNLIMKKDKPSLEQESLSLKEKRKKINK